MQDSSSHTGTRKCEASTLLQMRRGTEAIGPPVVPLLEECARSGWPTCPFQYNTIYSLSPPQSPPHNCRRKGCAAAYSPRPASRHAAIGAGPPSLASAAAQFPYKLNSPNTRAASTSSAPRRRRVVWVAAPRPSSAQRVS